MPHIFIIVLTLIGTRGNDFEQNVQWRLFGVRMKGDTEAKFPLSATKMRKITDHTSQMRSKCVHLHKSENASNRK